MKITINGLMKLGVAFAGVMVGREFPDGFSTRARQCG
jgi:hypothetical protein